MYLLKIQHLYHLVKKSNKGRGRQQYPGDSVVKGYFEGAEQLLKNDGYKKLKSK